MTVVVSEQAETDLEDAFDHYEAARVGLGAEFVTEFRRAIDLIIENPHAWQSLDPVYRRCRLHRFPYGIIYRVSERSQRIIIVAVMELHRHPDLWRKRLT